MLQYLKYVYLFLENSGCLFLECIFSTFQNYIKLFSLNKLHLSVIKRIGSASLFGIQIIYGLNSQPLEYILSMAVHFLPQKIYIVFVYMNSNTFWMLPANALYLNVCNLLYVDDLHIKVFVCCYLFLQVILSNLEYYRIILFCITERKNL